MIAGIFQDSRLLVVGAAAYSLSTLFSAMKPVLLARFVEELAYGPFLSGLIVAMPFVGLATASLVTRSLLQRVPFNVLLFCNVCLVVLVELASTQLFTSPAVLIALQAVGGVCVGVLMGMTSNLIAQTNQADQMFGFVDMVAVLLMSFMLWAVSSAVADHGIAGGYAAAVIISLLLGLLIVLARPRQQQVRITSNKDTLPWSVPAVVTVAMAVLFVTASGLGFAFMFTLAQRLDMDYALAGQLISIGLFVSALACWVGGWCGERFGHAKPLTAAFITCALGWFIAVNTGSAVIFLIALIPAVFSLQFCFPILLATCACLDDKGQWAAVATPLLTSGFAWAAICAGLLVETWGLNSLSWATVLGMATCLVLMVVARSTRSAKSALA